MINKASFTVAEEFNCRTSILFLVLFYSDNDIESEYR